MYNPDHKQKWLNIRQAAGAPDSWMQASTRYFDEFEPTETALHTDVSEMEPEAVYSMLTSLGTKAIRIENMRRYVAVINDYRKWHEIQKGNFIYEGLTASNVDFSANYLKYLIMSPEELSDLLLYSAFVDAYPVKAMYALEWENFSLEEITQLTWKDVEYVQGNLTIAGRSISHSVMGNFLRDYVAENIVWYKNQNTQFLQKPMINGKVHKPAKVTRSRIFKWADGFRDNANTEKLLRPEAIIFAGNLYRAHQLQTKLGRELTQPEILQIIRTTSTNTANAFLIELKAYTKAKEMLGAPQ